jgi:hypothetical protein
VIALARKLDEVKARQDGREASRPPPLPAGIAIGDADIGRMLVEGDGVLQRLSLIERVAYTAIPFELGDGRGGAVLALMSYPSRVVGPSIDRHPARIQERADREAHSSRHGVERDPGRERDVSSMTDITISDNDIGATVATGDGSLTSLSLVTAGPFSSVPLALVDGRGYALYLSDLLGLIPLDNATWGGPLLTFDVPFVNGLIVRSAPPGTSWSATVTP